MLLAISTVYLIGYVIIFASVMLDTTRSFSHDQRAMLNTSAGAIVVGIVLVFYPLWLFVGAWYGLIKSFKEALTTAKKAV